MSMKPYVGVCYHCGHDHGTPQMPVFATPPATTSAAAAGAIPAGYKLVPIEPTEAMVRAAHRREDGEEVYWPHPANAYRAMLAASPSPSEPVAQAEQQLNSLGIAENWAVTVEVEGRSVLCISNQHYAGDGELGPYKSTIRNCAQHLLAFVGAEPAQPQEAEQPRAQDGEGELSNAEVWKACEQKMDELGSVDAMKWFARRALASRPRLTDEQIEEIWKSLWGQSYSTEIRRRKFARAIERALLGEQ
jgi:hypothetical protein